MNLIVPSRSCSISSSYGRRVSLKHFNFLRTMDVIVSKIPFSGWLKAPRNPKLIVLIRDTRKLTSCFGNQSPLTSGFSSCSSLTQHSDLGFPRHSSSRKKLTPRSAWSTVFSSAMVNLPIPKSCQLVTPLRKHLPYLEEPDS